MLFFLHAFGVPWSFNISELQRVQPTQLDLPACKAGFITAQGNALGCQIPSSGKGSPEGAV